MSSGLVPSGGSRAESVPLSFPGSRGHLHSWLVTPSRHNSTSHFQLHISSHWLWPSRPLSHKDPWDFTWPTWISQDNLSVSRSLITSAKCLHALAPRTRTDIFAGPLFSLPHLLFLWLVIFYCMPNIVYKRITEAEINHIFSPTGCTSPLLDNVT